MTPSNASLEPKTVKTKPKGYQCFRACYATSRTERFWERMSEKRTVVAVPNPTAVNTRTTVRQMADGGRPRPTCERIHPEPSAGVNSQKEGSLLSPPNHGNDNRKSSVKRWMCQTTYDRYDRELSAGVNSETEGRHLASRTTATVVTSRFKREGCDRQEFQDEPERRWISKLTAKRKIQMTSFCSRQTY